MAAGYKMAAFEIREGFKDFPLPAGGPPEPPGGWCFANALDAVAQPATASALAPGAKLFLRPWHRWRAKQQRKTEVGLIEGILKRTHLDDMPKAAGWAGTKAIEAGRAVVGVPAALAGAAATRAARLIPRRGRPF